MSSVSRLRRSVSLPDIGFSKVATDIKPAPDLRRDQSAPTSVARRTASAPCIADIAPGMRTPATRTQFIDQCKSWLKKTERDLFEADVRKVSRDRVMGKANAADFKKQCDIILEQIDMKCRSGVISEGEYIARCNDIQQVFIRHQHQEHEVSRPPGTSAPRQQRRIASVGTALRGTDTAMTMPQNQSSPSLSNNDPMESAMGWGTAHY